MLNNFFCNKFAQYWIGYIVLLVIKVLYNAIHKCEIKNKGYSSLDHFIDIFPRLFAKSIGKMHCEI